METCVFKLFLRRGNFGAAQRNSWAEIRRQCGLSHDFPSKNFSARLKNDLIVKMLNTNFSVGGLV